MSWACAMVYVGQERLAVRNLERQEFQIFCPYFMMRRRGQSVPVFNALFPGYLFIQIDPQTSPWRKINSTWGIVRLLATREVKGGLDPKPLWIPDAFIESLGEQCQGTFNRPGLMVQMVAGKLTGMCELRPGTIVRVKNGAFLDQSGPVIGMTKDDRIRVLMKVFQRDHIVEFAYEDLEKV